jgi:hypothetical protein
VGFSPLCRAKALSHADVALDRYLKRYRNGGKIDWIVLDVAPNITDEHAI